MSLKKLSKGQKKLKCWRCGEMFWVYPYRKDTAKFCSRKCLNKSKNGNKYALGYRHSEKAIKKMSKTWFKKGEHPGVEFGKGEKHPQWQDGISFEPYGIEFNEKLKEQIRKRDHYRCQQCFRHQNELYYESGKKYSLLVHHIDYDKKNNDSKNLISLCTNCHQQTNFGREDWTNYFNQKQL